MKEKTAKLILDSLKSKVDEALDIIEAYNDILKTANMDEKPIIINKQNADTNFKFLHALVTNVNFTAFPFYFVIEVVDEGLKCINILDSENNTKETIIPNEYIKDYGYCFDYDKVLPNPVNLKCRKKGEIIKLHKTDNEWIETRVKTSVNKCINPVEILTKYVIY